MPRQKRKRGAQPGNTNALKHGFYSKALKEAEKIELEAARDLDGLDDEIALLRVKIKSLVERDEDNLKLLIDATSTLARLLRTRYNLQQHQHDGIRDAITGVLTDLAIPLGVTIAKGGL